MAINRDLIPSYEFKPVREEDKIGFGLDAISDGFSMNMLLIIIAIVIILIVVKFLYGLIIYKGIEKELQVAIQLLIKLFFRTIAISFLIFLPFALASIIEYRVDGMILQGLIIIPLYIVFNGIAYFWLKSLNSRRESHLEAMGREEHEKKYPFGAIHIIIVIIGFILGSFGSLFFISLVE